MTSFSESEVEQIALGLAGGTRLECCPRLRQSSPGTPDAEHDDCDQVVLERLLTDASDRLNADLPQPRLSTDARETLVPI